jgi:hypothetical protein
MNYIKKLKSLEFITSNQTIIATTYKSLKENKETITVILYEYIPELIRGFVCDIEHRYSIGNQNGIKLDKELVCLNYDLVLVYINKINSIDEIPQFEYIFYK